VDGKFTIIPWDTNMAFGTFNCFGLERERLINYYIDEPTCESVSERPLVERLLSYPPYRETYHRYLQELIDGPFSVEAMNMRIETLVGLIRPYVEVDDLKFYSTDDFDRNLTEDVQIVVQGAPAGSDLPVAIGLKSFVVERGQSVREQLEGKRPSADDGSGNWGDEVPPRPGDRPPPTPSMP